ncbi:hypothetical protein MTO96_002911 [Rhipicephalus appendiculatus]
MPAAESRDGKAKRASGSARPLAVAFLIDHYGIAGPPRDSGGGAGARQSAVPRMRRYPRIAGLAASSRHSLLSAR